MRIFSCTYWPSAVCLLWRNVYLHLLLIFLKTTFYFCIELQSVRDFPSGSVVENLPFMQEMWGHSLSWEDPLEERGQPTPVFLPGKPHGQRSLAGYSPQGQRVAEASEHAQSVNNFVSQLSMFYSFRWSAKGLSHIYTCIHSPLNALLLLIFFIGLFVFVLLNCMNCQYVLEIKPLLRFPC